MHPGAAPTALVGRTHDLERLATVLAAPHAGLVTVTGPAGVGKSRLVREFFHRHGPSYGSAVEVFDFGRATDAAARTLMLRRLGQRCSEGASGIQPSPVHAGTTCAESACTQAVHTEAVRPTLLLIDHAEDVTDELAPLLEELRLRQPQVRIVCAGTNRLGLYSERILRLGPLPTGGTSAYGEPPADDDPYAAARIPAVDLFVRYARSVRPEFALTAANTPSVVALCQRTGGLPLAIELAAEQVRLADPDLILERCERGCDGMRRSGRHPYSRHAGVADMVAWVLARLNAGEWTLLHHLAVFEGPFTARAAAGVLAGCGGGTYETVGRLIDKSVLVPEQRQDGELTLTIPAPVRQEAARTLAQLPIHPALRRAHAAYFRAAALRHTTGSPTAVEVGAVRSVARSSAGRTGGGTPDRTTATEPQPAMRADLLAAFGYWRDAGDGDAMAVLAYALREQAAGAADVRHGLRLTAQALRAGIGDPRLRARALEAAGEAALRLGSPAARRHLVRARDAYRLMCDENGVARCLGLLGDAAYAAGDLVRARARLTEGLAVLAAADRTAGTAGTPADAYDRGGTDSTDSAYGASDRPGTAAAAARRHLTRRLATVLREAGDHPRAEALAGAGLAADLSRADFDGATRDRYLLASVRWLDQDSARARALFADAAEQLGRLRGAAEQPECLDLLAITSWKWGLITDWRLVTAVLALADRLRSRYGLRRPRPLGDAIAPILAFAGQELTADAYAWAWHSGAELPWPAALRLIPDGAPAPRAVPEPPADVADILTKRELEVALLVAEGLTNRVIARRLGIAEWTAVNHLRRVMRKLGCQSRVQVTRRLTPA